MSKSVAVETLLQWKLPTQDLWIERSLFVLVIFSEKLWKLLCFLASRRHLDLHTILDLVTIYYIKYYFLFITTFNPIHPLPLQKVNSMRYGFWGGILFTAVFLVLKLHLLHCRQSLRSAEWNSGAWMTPLLCLLDSILKGFQLAFFAYLSICLG